MSIKTDEAGQGSFTATHTADNTVTSASETLLAANTARKGFVIQNTHATEKVRVRLDGGTATTTNGLQLAPGASLEMTLPCTTAAITGIREGAADATVHVVEFT